LLFPLAQLQISVSLSLDIGRQPHHQNEQKNAFILQIPSVKIEHLRRSAGLVFSRFEFRYVPSNRHRRENCVMELGQIDIEIRERPFAQPISFCCSVMSTYYVPEHAD
jgi:hypothetical protein